MGYRIGPFEIYGGIKRVGYVKGVNSLQPDGRHILMWDFDGVKPSDAMGSLYWAQQKDELGSIYVFDTQKEIEGGELKNLHAYCFTPVDWERAINIVWATTHVDPTYVKMSFVREYFTLRFSDKRGRAIKIHAVLKGRYSPDDVDPATIANFVSYKTRVN